MSSCSLSSVGADTSLNLGVACTSVGLGVGAGNTDVAEMATGLTLVRSSEEEGVGSGGGLHHELVKSHALAAGRGDAGTGSLGESEGRDLETGLHVENALIIGDGTDNNGSAVAMNTG